MRNFFFDLKNFFRDYRAYILLALSLGSLALSIFVFQFSWYRLIESLVDFGTSLAFYFGYIFRLDYEVYPTVLNYSQYDLANAFWLPFSWDGFLSLFWDGIGKIG